jgi:hypothetical protein
MGAVATAVCAFAAYLLIVGVNVSVSSGGPEVVERETMWSAVIPLAGGLSALVGAVRRRRSLVMGGSITVLVFGILFVFSAGPYFALIGIAMMLTALATRGAWVEPENDPVPESDVSGLEV